MYKKCFNENSKPPNIEVTLIWHMDIIVRHLVRDNLITLAMDSEISVLMIPPTKVSSRRENCGKNNRKKRDLVY